jgi:hypothetical protein
LGRLERTQIMGMHTHRSWANWMRWFSLRRSKPRGEHDFADYGTAFGLDMSMAASELPLESPAAADQPGPSISTAAIAEVRPALG